MRNEALSGRLGGEAGVPELDRLLEPVGGQSRLALAAFVVLAAAYLLTFGPFNSALVAFQDAWHSAVVLGSLVMLFVLGAHRHGRGGSVSLLAPFGTLALLLALLIVAMAGLHWAALTREPFYQSLNVAGGAAGVWLSAGWDLAVLYLFFPVLVPLQYLLLRNVSLAAVVRVVAVALLLSIFVQWVQGLWAPRFLNPWAIRSGGYGGLATDPNAYAMSALLVAPLLSVGAGLERSMAWRVFLVIVAGLAVAGLAWAGNRTAVGGLVVLLIMSAVIFAVAPRGLSIRWRLLLVSTPVLLAVAGFWLLEYRDELVAGWGLIGHRLVESWDKVQQGGLTGLFFKGEERGGLLLTGWALLWRSPLAGWGPGGFYREYPNELFFETGGIRAAFDSVLNHYLMVPIDFGLPALLFYLVLMLAPVVVGLLAVRRLQTTGPRLIVGTLLATQFVFLLCINTIPPAYFPDLVWLWTLQLGLLLVIGERAGVSMANWVPAGRPRTLALGVAVGLVAISMVAAYPVTFGSQGYRARLDAEGSPLRYDRNCYGEEQDGKNRWRWCGRNARVKLPLPADGEGALVLTLSASNPDLSKNPLTVRYGGLAGLTQELTLADPPWGQIRIPLDAAHIVEQPSADGKTVERFAVLSLDVSRTWVPKSWGISEDPRELGVSVHLPTGE